MANVKLPDPLTRRHLLEGQIDVAKARAYGEAYLEAGREVEAVDFLARGEATEALVSLRTAAADRGDVFLVRVVSGAIGDEPGPELWTRVAEAAAAAGREADADTARRLATVEA